MQPENPRHVQHAGDSEVAESNPAVVLRARGLVRRFGLRRAVDDVSLVLSTGDCVALFGPNGAGKTTLLRMLGGLLKPTAGAVDIGTLPATDSGRRRLVGLISHHTLLYAPLTARENVRFAAQCHGMRDADDAALRALTRLQVEDRADTPVRLLSRGLQQRVSIARALVHEPRIVLLDEPYTGLDDIGARALTAALLELRAHGAAMVLVTHHLGEGLAMATRTMVMLNGRVVHTHDARTEPVDIDAFTARYRELVTTGTR
jgi:heme exporter protein A